MIKIIKVITLIVFVLCRQQGCQGQDATCFNILGVVNLVESQLCTDTILKQGLLKDSISISVSYYYELNDLNENLDTLFFSNEDIKHLTCQAEEQSQYLYWHQILSNTSAIISDAKIEMEIFNNDWESYRKRYGEGFYSYSIPLLSAKGDKAIMIKKYTCGPFCGFTKILLVIRENENWTICKEILKGKR